MKRIFVILLFVFSNAQAGQCDLIIHDPLYNSCYSFKDGLSRYIEYIPHSNQLHGFGDRNPNFISKNSPEDNETFQARALLDNNRDKGAFRQYCRFDFKEDPHLPFERSVNVDVLNGTGYFRGLMMTREMAPQSEQGNLFFMTNVQPMTEPVYQQMKLLDKQVASDLQLAESNGNQLVVYVGNIIYQNTGHYFQGKNTFGIEAGMSEPVAYFKFWYEKTNNGTQPSIVRGYVIPNTKNLHSLSHYRASISKIERLSGLQFNLVGYENSYQQEKLKERIPGSETSSGHSVRVEIDPFKLLFGLFGSDDTKKNK